MPFSYTPLWNTLNQYNMGKYDLCQTIGISSSTMAKMTNNQKVSMDILARICDYFACGLEDVVVYKSEMELFMEKIEGEIMDGGYRIYAQQFPEYRFHFSDAQMLGIQQIDYIDIESALRKFETAAVNIHPVHVPIMGTTTFRVSSSRNLVTMQGSLTVVELFMEWFLEKISKGEERTMNNERTIFEKLLNKSEAQIKKEFDCSDDGKDTYVFRAKSNSKHYINVCGKQQEFLAPVNADFDFARPAGSNNYEELYRIAEKFYRAFGLEPTEYLQKCFDNH